MERIKQEKEIVPRETTELSTINDILRKQADELMEDREKLLSDNIVLKKQQNNFILCET